MSKAIFMQIDLIQLEVLKKRLAEERKIEIKIISNSMEPLLKIEEKISAVPVTKKIEVFDLIVFWRDGRLFCHYVWRNQISFNKTVITRSFKNLYSDEKPVESRYILAIISGKKINFCKKSSILLKNILKRSI